MSTPPRTASVELWAWDYIHSDDLQYKLDPPGAPAIWEDSGEIHRLERPGRPSDLQVVAKASKAPRRGALQQPRRRAELIHTFLHHEMQAAELMCWALLAFPQTPAAFRRGLLGICGEEISHLQLYRDYLHRAGVAFGDFPVRDWFWARVPRCRNATEFVAVMGMGFEAGNLDHISRYEEWFTAAGDQDAVAILRTVRQEEVGHVRFAAHWFRTFTGGIDFDTWRQALPAPLSPTLMHGAQINTVDRQLAGFTPEFMELLRRW
jgi:uncharacterized ferritin-like protein (DUF455 family)